MTILSSGDRPTWEASVERVMICLLPAGRSRPEGPTMPRLFTPAEQQLADCLLRDAVVGDVTDSLAQHKDATLYGDSGQAFAVRRPALAVACFARSCHGQVSLSGDCGSTARRAPRRPASDWSRHSTRLTSLSRSSPSWRMCWLCSLRRPSAAVISARSVPLLCAWFAPAFGPERGRRSWRRLSAAGLAPKSCASLRAPTSNWLAKAVASAVHASGNELEGVSHAGGR